MVSHTSSRSSNTSQSTDGHEKTVTVTTGTGPLGGQYTTATTTNQYSVPARQYVTSSMTTGQPGQYMTSTAEAGKYVGSTSGQIAGTSGVQYVNYQSGQSSGQHLTTIPAGSYVQHSGIQHSGIQHSGLQQSGIQYSGIQQSGVQHSGIQHSGIHYSGVQNSGIQYTGVQNSGVRHVSGQQTRMISGNTPQMQSSTSNIDYSMAREVSAVTLTGRETVLSERVVEHEVKVPKRIVREDIIEKVIVVPERVVHEEVVEELQIVREKIIEVAKPIYHEKIIEVPEIEYVEKIVEVCEKIYQEKIREVPRIDIQQRVIEVPKIVTTEKIVEVPEIEYREVPVEKIVEVLEIREQIAIKEMFVPQYVDKPIAEYVNVEVPNRIERNIPVPVEAVTTFEYRLPHIRPHYKKATFPIYVPRFVEVPVPEELVTGAVGLQATELAQHVSLLTTQAAPSLCEIENIAADIKKMDLASQIASSDYHATIQQAWTNGGLVVTQQSHQGNVMQRDAAVSNVSGVARQSGANWVPVVYNKQSTADRKPSSRTRGESTKSPSPKKSHKESTRSHKESHRSRADTKQSRHN